MSTARMRIASIALTGVMAFSCCAGFISLQPVDACASSFEIQAADSSPDDHIGKSAAKKIALAHAHFKAKQVRDIKVSFGTRRGKAAYLVTFQYKKLMRYAYAINAETGRIISYSAKAISKK